MTRSVPNRLALTLAAIALLCLPPRFLRPARADEVAKAAIGQQEPVKPVEFQQETLENGLRVIYAPLHQAPVVHVRVLYHVGSRDERPDHQGFAHMFEHMMFRGSAHVRPDQHMKLIDDVGGISNAFTSFDETVYHDTVPASALEMALYLEADRMSSFKVTEDIYKIERRVVAEEWRIRQNKPYGNLYDDFLKNAFVSHSYRWTPIGNMDDLRRAPVSDLQEFFNTYYLPNNAVLVVSGDIDVDAARAMVKKYFGWVPRGPDAPRIAPAEPEQTQARQATVNYRVPLAAVVVGYHLPPYRSDDQYALSILATILGDGRASRLDRLLVNNDNPQCVNVSAEYMPLEDGGIFGVNGIVMHGKDPDGVQKVLEQAVVDVLAKGVSEDELNKAKTQSRISEIKSHETATSLATELGDEALYADDPGRVNRNLAKLDAITAADVQAVAKKYLTPEKSTVLRVNPDPLGVNARAAAAITTQASMDVPVAPSTRPVAPREVQFPAGYAMTPPAPELKLNPQFQKGTESEVDGVKVIVMPDHRLPLVSWVLTVRRGSHLDPAGKEGLAALTDSMLRRGCADLSYQKLNEDLESRAISLEVTDAGDVTKVIGASATDQLDHGLLRTRQVLFSPTFPQEEFDRQKEQMVNGLALSQENPSTVADHDMATALYGTSPLGVTPTPQSVSTITLDDVKKFYASQYRREGAILVLAGDLTVERGREMAGQLLAAWPKEDVSASQAPAYQFPETSSLRHIELVDRPGARGASVRIGIRAYDIHTDDKFAGSLASQILSAGIESRLNKYVRAEKGLSYGVHGVFAPNRHGGSFVAGTECAVENCAASVEAIFKVLNDMRRENVTPEELSTAKTRVAGSMVMGMQTIQQQAGLRVDGLLNGYPIDYYDVYPARVGAVTADQVREVMNKYVDDGRMTIVVVAPGEETRQQLQTLGQVKEVPMPSHRGAGAQPTTPELLKPTTKAAG
jgi:zinc protease